MIQHFSPVAVERHCWNALELGQLPRLNTKASTNLSCGQIRTLHLTKIHENDLEPILQLIRSSVEVITLCTQLDDHFSIYTGYGTCTTSTLVLPRLRSICLDENVVAFRGRSGS